MDQFVFFKEDGVQVHELGSTGPAPEQRQSTEDLVADPRRWTRMKKLRVTVIICLYTSVVYLGSTLCLGMYATFLVKDHVTVMTASMSMALYVAGYGLGALFFSPLSEVVSIGRNPPYLASFTLFVATTAGLCYIENFSAIVALRFFQGFFGSPALATGGGSLADIYHMPELPFAFTAWVAAATCGPAFGPAISIYGATAHDYKWPMWLLFWLSFACLILMFAALPETFAPKLEFAANKRCTTPLDQHARIETETGSQSIVYTCISIVWKPLKIMFTNPAIFFANFYTCLIYAIYYSFFESFPHVYLEVYKFSLEHMSSAFLAIAIGTVLGVIMYLPWASWWCRRSNDVKSPPRPEICLAPAIFGSVLVSTGLTLFALTSNQNFHWLVGLTGVAVQTAGLFVVLQCLANYLLLAYPHDAASLLAGNDLMRAALAAGAIIGSQPLYTKLGVANSVTILASATVLCVIGVILMYVYGHHARR